MAEVGGAPGSGPLGIGPSGGDQESDWQRYVRPTLWGLLALFSLLFVLFNLGEVNVSFVLFTVTIKMIWVLLLAIVLGALLSEGARRWWARRKRKPTTQKAGPAE